MEIISYISSAIKSALPTSCTPSVLSLIPSPFEVSVCYDVYKLDAEALQISGQVLWFGGLGT